MLYSCYLSRFCLFILSCTLLFLYHTNSYSAPFPRGCEVTGFGYNGGHLVVNETGKQSFFLIQNRSSIPIKMQRVETRNIFMSPPLTIQLDPLNWAAFASDVGNFHFECLITENDMVTAINCRDVLEICQYPRVRFALSNMGNYWVSANKAEQQQIINDAVNKGIYLKW